MAVPAARLGAADQGHGDSVQRVQDTAGCRSDRESHHRRTGHRRGDEEPEPGGTPPVVPFNTVSAPAGDPKLIEELQTAKVTYHFERPPNWLGGLLLNLLPLVLLGSFWYMAYRRGGGAAGGGLGGIFGVGKSKATEVKPEDVGVTYKDVGGADEAIAELQEIIQFLKTPEKFASLGGRIPKGVLLVGPPGHRQDAAGQGDGRRSRRCLLRDQRLRVRRDVRRRGRGARARPVREGAQGCAGDRLHRRDRRHRPEPAEA